MRSHVKAADDYARSVVSGKILACKWVKLACRRYIEDRKEARSKAGRWRFDAPLVEDVCAFVELLPHTKGEWAAEEQSITLEPWQSFIFANIFGFISRATGYRRFRRAYLEIPRKNGKSIIAAAIGLVMMLLDGEAGPEVYSGATTKKQAKEVFTPARLMALRCTDLREAFSIEVNKESLYLPDGGKFEPVIGKPGDGSSPSCAIIDEYHEHRTDELREAMVHGMKARRQPLTIFITTAGFNLESPCARQNGEARQILEGVIEDEQTFTVIWTIDEGDDWRTEEALQKANPNYGVSIYPDALLDDLREALNTPSKAASYKTKHLNIWVRAGNPYFNLEMWRQCGTIVRTPDEPAPLIPKEFWRYPCIIGMDLASKRDLTALVFLFHLGEERFALFSRFYLPESQVDEVRTTPYGQWKEQGWLTVTDGNITDYNRIQADLLELREYLQIVELAYDPHDATQLANNLLEAGMPMVMVEQSTKNFSEPMQQVDADIMSGRLQHDSSPVMTWNVANTIGKQFGNKKVRPMKEREASKIDGAVATIMARGRWIAHVEEAPSRYEDAAVEHVW